MWRKKYARSSYTAEELLAQLASQNRGLVFLEGPSSCGKTRLLHRLRKESDRVVSVVSYQFFTDRIILGSNPDPDSPDRRRLQTLEKELDCAVFCVEDIDYLSKKTVTQELVAANLQEYAKTRLVIVTGIDLRKRVKTLLSGCKHSSLYIYNR